MNSRIDKIKSNPQAKLIADELDKVSAIDAVYQSEGGQILYKSLMKDVVSGIETLMVKYPKLEREDFIAILAEVKSKFELARVLKRSTKNKEQALADLEKELGEV